MEKVTLDDLVRASRMLPPPPVKQDVVRRTAITLHPVKDSVLYPGQAFRWHFTITLEDGTTREIWGRNNGGIHAAANAAVRRFLRYQDHGYED